MITFSVLVCVVCTRECVCSINEHVSDVGYFKVYMGNSGTCIIHMASMGTYLQLADRNVLRL